MDPISISDLLSYIVPLILVYNGWLHNQVIKAQINIAVANEKDDNIIKEIGDLNISVERLAKEVHNFMLAYASGTPIQPIEGK